MEVRKHNPHAKPDLDRCCGQDEQELLDDPESFDKQYGSDPMTKLVMSYCSLPLHYESDELFIDFLATFLEFFAHYLAVFCFLSMVLQCMQTLVGLITQSDIGKIPIVNNEFVPTNLQNEIYQHIYSILI